MTVHFGSTVYQYSTSLKSAADVSRVFAIHDFPERFHMDPISLRSDSFTSRFNRHTTPEKGTLTIYDASGRNEVVRFLLESNDDGDQEKVKIIVDDDQLAKTPMVIGKPDSDETKQITPEKIDLLLQAYLSGAGVPWGSVTRDAQTYKEMNMGDTQRALKQAGPNRWWA